MIPGVTLRCRHSYFTEYTLGGQGEEFVFASLKKNKKQKNPAVQVGSGRGEGRFFSSKMSTFSNHNQINGHWITKTTEMKGCRPACPTTTRSHRTSPSCGVRGTRFITQAFIPLGPQAPACVSLKCMYRIGLLFPSGALPVSAVWSLGMGSQGRGHAGPLTQQQFRHRRCSCLPRWPGCFQQRVAKAQVNGRCSVSLASMPGSVPSVLALAPACSLSVSAC